VGTPLSYRCLSVVSWSSMANRSTSQRLLRQRSSRLSNTKSKRAYDTSRRWLITILRPNITLCMFCILFSYSLVGLDCCHTFSGVACEGLRIIVILLSVLDMVVSPLLQFRMPVAACGFTPLRWERCKGYVRLSPSSIPACLNSLLCCLCLPRPANT